ncbi:MAG: hypothetical protein LR120_04900 [Dehalococcoidia bacterium]|nr:hypothetical protein [Dehalococcoidia bacterium]
MAGRVTSSGRPIRERTQKRIRWAKNYTELNFRALGSYTRADLERIASEPDAFQVDSNRVVRMQNTSHAERRSGIWSPMI